MDKVPTTDQIRNAIDKGITGEKIPFPDPAAAPLGTDAEAGGNAPTRMERALEARSQIERLPGIPANGVLIYLVLVAVAAVAIVLIGSLA